MISIILVEDHNIVRNGIRNLLEKEKYLNVIAEATNGLEVLELVKNGAEPDIIISDMNMPEMNGIELTEKLKEISSKAKIILLTMIDHEKYVTKAFKAGVNGYLLKNISSDELIFAIMHIHTEGRYICSELSLRLLDRLTHLPEPYLSNGKSEIEFSKREMEVLTLTAEGLTNQQIADQLFTSKRTVEGHRQIMINKTGTRNAISLVKYALQHGIIN